MHARRTLTTKLCYINENFDGRCWCDDGMAKSLCQRRRPILVAKVLTAQVSYVENEIHVPYVPPSTVSTFRHSTAVMRKWQATSMINESKKGRKKRKETIDEGILLGDNHNATIHRRSTHFNLHLLLNHCCRDATRVHGCNNGCVTAHKFIGYLLWISYVLMRKRDNLEDATKAHRSSAIACCPKKTMCGARRRCSKIYFVFSSRWFYPGRVKRIFSLLRRNWHKNLWTNLCEEFFSSRSLFREFSPKKICYILT